MIWFIPRVGLNYSLFGLDYSTVSFGLFHSMVWFIPLLGFGLFHGLVWFIPLFDLDYSTVWFGLFHCSTWFIQWFGLVYSTV